MSVEFTRYFQNNEPPIENGQDAFLRVRVTKDLEPNGSLIVYLPSGTALRVRGRDLLRANAENTTNDVAGLRLLESSPTEARREARGGGT